MSVLVDAVESVLEWLPRVLKLLPVFRDLWTSVQNGDPQGQFAAQLEMVRQIREQQARESFPIHDQDDEDTQP